MQPSDDRYGSWGSTPSSATNLLTKYPTTPSSPSRQDLTMGDAWSHWLTENSATTPSRQQPEKKRPRGCFLATIFLALGLVLGCLGGWALALANIQANSNSNRALSEGTMYEEVAAKVRPAVVLISAEANNGNGSIGSGVIIDQRGYIVTNYHVIEGSSKFEVVFYDARAFPAELIGVDPMDDLAIIKINPPRNIPVARIGDSSRLQVGEPVLAIGNPLGITQTVTSGIISAVDRTIGESDNAMIVNAIQTDAAINPGNSGGALVNMYGEVIGIPTLVPIDPTFSAPANGIGFAVPSNRVTFITPQLIESGRITHSGRADLGLNVITVDPSIAQRNQLQVNEGALIVEVRPGSAADQSGFREGDVIIQLDQTPIYNAASLQDEVIKREPGTTVTIKVQRGNDQEDIRVRLGERSLS